MINGLYPSQLGAAEEMRNSHYRNMSRIVNKAKMNISWLPSDFMNVTRRKRLNHENWKLYTRKQLDEQRYKRNASIYDRLQKISTAKSRYDFKTEASSPKDPLLHHNYLYECQRRFDSIQRNNSIIASKIMTAKRTYNHRKDASQFQQNKLAVSRLQKFQRHQRMNRLVCRSLNRRYHTTTENFSDSRLKTDNPEN